MQREKQGKPAPDSKPEPTRRQKEDVIARVIKDDPELAAKLLRQVLEGYSKGK